MSLRAFVEADFELYEIMYTSKSRAWVCEVDTMDLSFHWEVGDFQPSPAALSLFLIQFEVECESFSSALEYQSLIEEAQKMTATMVRTTPAIVLQRESLISVCAFRGSSCITDSQTSAVPNRHKWRTVNRSILVFLRDGDSRDAYPRDEVK
jgi:hypothetical protein